MPIAKHDTMRSVNTSIVLNCLCKHGPMTRQELQSRTGLSWGAVSNIVGQLLSLKVLCETLTSSSHAGRKPAAVFVNPENNLLIGVDINMQGVVCVATELSGRVLARERQSIAQADRQEVLGCVKSLVRSVMAQVNVKPERYIGIGISVQGSIDPSGRISLLSPHLPNWKHVPVCDVLEAEFHLPALLVHDTNAMLLAERRVSDRNARSIAFVKLDMGLNLSLVLNGALYTGCDGNASEFGHIIINPDGPACTCGNHGCLEAYASGRALLAQAWEGVRSGACRLPLTEDDYQQNIALLAKAARDGSAFEKQLFERMGKYLGIGLANLVNFLNPELMLLGGELSQYRDLYLDSAMAVVGQNVWSSSRVQLFPSKLDADGAAVGAALALLNQVFSGHIAHPLAELFRGLHNAARPE